MIVEIAVIVIIAVVSIMSIAIGEEYENTTTTKDKVLDLYNKMLNMTGEEPINKSKVSFSDGICKTGNPLYLEKLFPENYCHEV